MSVWPYVEGEWPDSGLPEMRVQGARLLARLHRALAGLRPPPRPVPSFLEIGLYGEPPHDVPELADPELDRWLAAFHRRNPVRRPLHGDFYTGNTLARDGRLVAVLDWDEAAYFEHARSRGAEHDKDDLAYHERRVRTFYELRP